MINTATSKVIHSSFFRKDNTMNNPTVPDIAKIITKLRAYLNLSRVKFGAPLGLSPTQIML